MTRFKEILCPTDFSSHAAHALDVAIDLARSLGSSLWLVHVIPPPLVFGHELANSGLTAELIKAQQATATAALEHVLEHCRAAGMNVQSQVEVGPPALTIVELSHKADLVVMGTRGNTGFEHLFLGSVAERVARYAKCPVLVVRSEPADRVREPAAAG